MYIHMYIRMQYMYIYILIFADMYVLARGVCYRIIAFFSFSILLCIHVYISSLCDRFLIENWSNLISIQHGTLELSMGFILHWTLISSPRPTFSRKHMQNQRKPIQFYGAQDLIIWKILNLKMINCHSNVTLSSKPHYLIDS